MTTEREQLELAAKACGIKLHQWVAKGCWSDDPSIEGFQTAPPDCDRWNPLRSDGDCARMAAQLGLSILPYPVYEHPKTGVLVEFKQHAECPKAEPPMRYCPDCTNPCQRKIPNLKMELYFDHAGDKNAARRAASVAVAAEIGRLM